MFRTTFILSAALASAPMVFANAVPGKAAPQFEVQDADGKTRRLAEFAGKWVVLEWYNKDCPFVEKHYDSGNMQKLQKAYTAKGVVWLSVNSSAKGKQGHTDGKEALKVAKAKNSAASSVLLDPTGAMGKAYGAKTTPHMYVIDPQGMLVYAGAIDDNDSSDPATIDGAKNYVAAALDAGLANKKIEMASTKAYGCSVKY